MGEGDRPRRRLSPALVAPVPLRRRPSLWPRRPDAESERTEAAVGVGVGVGVGVDWMDTATRGTDRRPTCTTAAGVTAPRLEPNVDADNGWRTSADTKADTGAPASRLA